jgi:aspartyl/asparaginyl-tRNA synthetase
MNKITDFVPHIDPVKFDKVVQKLRDFFRTKGFTEAYTQNRLSILAACEDPGTISCFNYANDKWPLIQTNQMWLEHLLLKNPSVKGLYCLSTSYRHEPNPIPGRHCLIFPLFEFESRGDVEDMIKLEKELLLHLGFKPKGKDFPRGKYQDLCDKYNCETIEAKQENKLKDDYGSVFFLTDFTEKSNPYWNMRERKDGNFDKVDVIVGGMETIGSAERSSDAKVMREKFHSTSDGEYAQILYDKFGKERVESELEEFLSLPFCKRYGGGIGMTRLISAMEAEGLL